MATNIVAVGSTIEHNEATRYGGVKARSGDVVVINSTISSNAADEIPALSVSSGAYASQIISNSTIAFNHANLATSKGAVGLSHSNGSSINLESSIIARNTAGPGGAPSDLYVSNGLLTGSNNLVIATNQSPPNVITVMADPNLAPLQFNGGYTRTHALLPGSPAVGAGNNAFGRPYDARGPGYPRGSGPANVVDIGAIQFDMIFTGFFDYR